MDTSAPANPPAPRPASDPASPPRPPTALTIAGSDSGGGAGIQADLKTFSALGVYGMSAITALTCQNTLGVQDVVPIGPDAVAAQLTSVLDDLPVDATKLGMLTSADVIAAVAALVRERGDRFGTIVLDPVMVATSGDVLLPEAACATLRDELLPFAHVVTPNLPEAAKLLDTDVAASVDEMQDQARALTALGPAAVVLKGGHRACDEVVDVVACGDDVELLRADRVRTRNTHGTGCTLSSAIAAQYARASRADAGALARADHLTTSRDAASLLASDDATSVDLAAITAGRDFLQRALSAGAGWELSSAPAEGHGPVDHMVTVATAG